MSDRREVIVLGAGIAGAAVAHHLCERSIGPVTLYDPRTPAAGATGRAAGIVTEQMWDRWDFDVVRETREEYAQLSAEHDRSAYRVNGFVRWTARPVIGDALQAAGARLRAWGANVHSLTPAEVKAHLPAVRTDGIRHAWFDPDDAIVTPSALTDIYLESARSKGAEILLGDPYRGLRREGPEWALEVGARTVRSRNVVVAAGAWSKKVFQELGTPLPLAPYRTQAALLLPPEPRGQDFPSAHDLDLDVYLRPEANGRILAGDGTRLVEVDPDTAPASADDEFVAHLAESFGARFPGWADAALVRAWAGVCVSTSDRRPLIGPVPGAEGLYALCGFNGFGVMRAGGAARRLAEVIAAEGGGRAADRIGPVLPGRFATAVPAFTPRPGFTLEGGLNPRF
ncbi:MAG: FAD-binding oxidoreductase [Thermoplasmata archaeon]